MSEYRKFSYSYVDDCGHKWIIDLEETGKFRQNMNNNLDDSIWRYYISREDRAISFNREITCELCAIPNIEDILLDFTTYIISVSLGFSKNNN